MPKTWRILCIDGGGIRGIMPALFLAKMEKAIGKQCSEVFDLIAGTSTGGIIALGLTKPIPMSATELVDLYENDGPQIFHHPGFFEGREASKYSSKGIEQVLKRRFDGTYISEALIPVMVTSYDLRGRRPFLIKSWKAKVDDTCDFLMRDAARATSAAPTFFTPPNISARNSSEGPRALIDGGLFANNPTACAYAEVRGAASADDSYLIVSIGAGSYTRRYSYNDVVNWMTLDWVRPIIDISFDGSSESVDYQMHKLISKSHSESEYFRFQVDLQEGLDSIDNTDVENYNQLKSLANSLFATGHLEPKFTELCKLLRTATNDPAGSYKSLTEN